MLYTIKTHKLNTTYNTPYFFILNKGLNSGRPMKDSCPNCFVVQTDSVEDRDKLFYLVQAFQIGKAFMPMIKGSVVPFITVGDTKSIINTAVQNYNTERWDIKIKKLKQILQYENNLKQQLETLSKLKLAILRI